MSTVDYELLTQTTDIVSAVVSRSDVPAAELPALIRSVYVALRTAASYPAVIARPEPAVPVHSSVFPDYIVCLEDGKKLTMLKRHLRTYYGLTPQAYRTRWGAAVELSNGAAKLR